MRISDQTIEDIKQAADILEVIEDFFPLKKKGQNWWALSPFTNEKTPSFAVNPAKGIFKCFSTGKGGDSISFIMEMEGVGYIEALKHLANKYGIELEQEEQTPEQQAEQTLKESLYAALTFANNYYQNLLYSSDEGKSVGLSYFKQRGFKEHTLKDFELGYSLDDWNAFENHALKNGFKSDILIQAGLVLQKEGSDRRYDRFRGRVMFPIHNVSGRVIGFGARTLKKDKQAKYLNSPESEVYHKSDVLYGIYQSKKEIRNQDNAYLVEGYTDVISLHQAGIKNVVASSGTSLTESQIRLLKRFTPNITVLYDGDAAGIKAAMRGVDMLLSEDLNVRVVQFPEGHDPDSYVQEVGGEAFKAFLKEASKDFILFKTQLYLSESGDDPLKRGEAVRDIVRSIAKMPDPIKRTVFYQQCSQLLNIGEDLLAQEGNRIIEAEEKRAQKQAAYQKKREERKSTPTPPPLTSNAPDGALPSPTSFEDLEGMSFSEEDVDFQLPDGEYFEGEAISEVSTPPAEIGQTENKLPIGADPEAYAISQQEKESIRLLIQYSEASLDGETYISDYLLAEVEELEFRHPVYKDIIEDFRKKKMEGKPLSPKTLLSHHNPEVREEISGLMMDASKYSLSANWWEKHQIFVPDLDEDLGKIAYQHVLRLKFRMLKRLVANAIQAIQEADTIGKQTECIKIQMELKKQENEVAKILGTLYS